MICCPLEFEGCLRELACFQVSFRVSRVFRMFLRVLQGVFKEPPRMLQESYKGVSSKCQWCFEEVSRAFQRSYMDIS